jgi:hypothetical protein
VSWPPITWQGSSTVITTVLSAASAALTGSGGPVIERTTLAPGAEAAWDACDCGQLALVVRRRYPSRSFPGDASDVVVGNCASVLVVFDCALSLVRCVPGADENGDPPKVADLNAAVAVQESDAFVLWQSVTCTLTALRDSSPQRVSDFIVNDVTSLGPQGMCGGVELHFKFGLYVPCEC